MNTVKYYFWLLTQVYSAMVYYWYVTAIFFFIFIALAFLDIFKKKFQFNLSLKFIYPWLNPFIIVLWGAIFSSAKSQIIPGILVYTCLVFPVIINLQSIFKVRENRYYTIGLVIFMEWISLMAVFISGMSIANDWL